MIFYVGDIHGFAQDVAMVDNQAIKDGVSHVIQVGDFGYWPQTKPADIYGRNNPKYPKKLPVASYPAFLVLLLVAVTP